MSEKKQKTIKTVKNKRIKKPLPKKADLIKPKEIKEDLAIVIPTVLKEVLPEKESIIKPLEIKEDLPKIIPVVRKKQTPLFPVIILLAVAVCLSLLIYFGGPLVYDRYFAATKKVILPNTNEVFGLKISPSTLTKILIPAIGTDADIILAPDDLSGSKNDWVESRLDFGIAQYPNGITDLKKQNLVFFGHSSSIHPNAEYALVWVRLDQLKIGDEIVLLNENEERINYKVTENPKTISANETSIVAVDKGEGMITLVTCWPPGTTQKRMVVTGTLSE